MLYIPSVVKHENFAKDRPVNPLIIYATNPSDMYKEKLPKLPPILLAIGLVISSLTSKSCSCSNLPNPMVQVCFTPGGQCSQFVEEAITQAQHTILVQAYFFTAPTIAKALVQAHKRKVTVQVMVDQSQLTTRGSQVSYLIKQGIPTYVDVVPGIAHNKVMIIDEQYVLTGSFNWTDAAQNNNAENLVLIKDPTTNKTYRSNWQQRLSQAKAITLSDIKQAKSKTHRNANRKSKK